MLGKLSVAERPDGETYVLESEALARIEEAMKKKTMPDWPDPWDHVANRHEWVNAHEVSRCVGDSYNKARAQAAMIQGLENELAGVRSGRIIPALQNVAHLRDHPQPTLTDLPVRVLLGTLGRQVPDAAGVVRDLERLLGAEPPKT
jgi:hypothetical protein